MMRAAFDPAHTALVLVDHQVGTVKLVRNLPHDRVKANTLALAKAARILGMPVVLTSSQEDRAQGPLFPELQPIVPEAFAARVKRAGIVNAWNDPNFRRAVRPGGGIF